MKSGFAALTAGWLMLTMGIFYTWADGDHEVVPKSTTKENNKKSRQSVLPGHAMWDLLTFQKAYRIVSTEYDPASRQVTWTLEANNKVITAGYRAVFRDADKVKCADVSIALTPASQEYEKGSRIKAILTLPAWEAFAQTDTVIVYPK
jgi:hypothetical protein